MKPTDEQILGVLQKHGACMTYVVAGVLRRNFHPLETSFVHRRLKALEKAGRAERVPTPYVVQHCWRATGQKGVQQ